MPAEDMDSVGVEAMEDPLLENLDTQVQLGQRRNLFSDDISEGYGCICVWTKH